MLSKIWMCIFWLSLFLNLQDLTVILSTLLPVICTHNDNKDRSDFSVGLKVHPFSCLVFISINWPSCLVKYILLSLHDNYEFNFFTFCSLVACFYFIFSLKVNRFDLLFLFLVLYLNHFAFRSGFMINGPLSIDLFIHFR